jgi:hypothetical protein
MATVNATFDVTEQFYKRRSIMPDLDKQIPNDPTVSQIKAAKAELIKNVHAALDKYHMSVSQMVSELTVTPNRALAADGTWLFTAYDVEAKIII